MAPRKSAAEAARTRDRIIHHAVAVASVEGLEGLTIGRLASELSLSKAGVLGHFGTKEQLQLAAVREAITMFREAVWEPAAGAPAGIERLRRLCEGWLAYLDAGVFPGGCFLTAASCEFDGRPGPVREAIAAGLAAWHAVLADDVNRAILDGDLPAETDSAQVVFELTAIAQGTNQAIQLHRDPEAPLRGRRAVRRLIGPLEASRAST